MRLLIIVIILGIFTSCNQDRLNKEMLLESEDSKVTNTIDSFLSNDTIFIYRNYENNKYHAIYIEKNRSSAYYQELMNFEFDKYDWDAFYGNWSIREKNNRAISVKLETDNLPSEWLPVYYYNGESYLYFPSERGSIGRKILLDSVYVRWGMDGPDPNPLISIDKINESEYKIIYDPYHTDLSLVEINIYIINHEKGLTIWEFVYPSRSYYQMYIPKEKAKNFDMIINYSPNRKMNEFEFEEFNFKKLINDANTK